MKKTKHKHEDKEEISFLYYTNYGKCLSNSEMPASTGAFKGWLSAASVIRNQDRHSMADVNASKNALSEFLDSLKGDETIKEKDLIQYV